MNEKLTRLLKRKFPRLYSEMPRFGLECGNGWFKLIHDLSEKLEASIALSFKENPQDSDAPRVRQVKEKFGTLRFYLSSSTDEMERAISEAEESSATICDTCGLPGELNQRGWLRVGCYKHRKH